MRNIIQQHENTIQTKYRKPHNKRKPIQQIKKPDKQLETPYAKQTKKHIQAINNIHKITNHTNKQKSTQFEKHIRD